MDGRAAPADRRGSVATSMVSAWTFGTGTLTLRILGYWLSRSRIGQVFFRDIHQECEEW